MVRTIKYFKRLYKDPSFSRIVSFQFIFDRFDNGDKYRLVLHSQEKQSKKEIRRGTGRRMGVTRFSWISTQYVANSISIVSWMVDIRGKLSPIILSRAHSLWASWSQEGPPTQPILSEVSANWAIDAQGNATGDQHRRYHPPRRLLGPLKSLKVRERKWKREGNRRHY